MEMESKADEAGIGASKSGESSSHHDAHKEEDHSKRPEYSSEPGPIDNRRCRDIFFLILFILFWIGMFVVAGVAIKAGNPNLLKYGVDYQGNLCGVKNSDYSLGTGRDLSAKPYLYYFTPGSISTIAVCVSACPASFVNYLSWSNYTEYLDQAICLYDSPPPQTVADVQQNCSVSLFDTSPVLYRCMPIFIQNEINGTAYQEVVQAGLNARSLATQVYQNLLDSWYIILICCGVALGLSVVWLLMIQYLGGFMVWLTIVFTLVVSGGLTAILWIAYYNLITFTPTVVVDTLVYNQKVLLAFAIFASIVFGIILLLVLFARRRIQLAIKIISETSKAVRTMPLIFVLPLFKWASLLSLFAWCIYIMVMLATAGSTRVQQQLSNLGVNDQTLSPDTALNALQIYYVFGLFWTWNFVVGVGEVTIAGAVASWYWTRDKKSLHFPVLRSLYRTMRYHLGSIAFGALIIAIVQLIRYLIQRAERTLKGREGQIIKFVLKCLDCCFACVERFLKFITKNAFIEVAVYGYSFCEAARMAFDRLVRNAFRLFVVDKITDFLLFLGKIVIMCGVGVIAIYMFQFRGQSAQDEAFYAIPFVFIMVFAWAIASCFTAVFEMAVLTIFLCFCEDCERNDGNAKPYYMPDSLRAFVSGAKKQEMSEKK